MVLSEKQILEGVERRDNRCQSLFYRQHAPLLFGVALRYTHSYEDAKEVLQDAFMKVFDNIKQYSGEGAIQAWMARVVINQALTLHKLRRNRPTLYSLDDDNQEEMEDKSVAFSDTLTHEILLRFIRELADGYRIIFNLCEIDGYSHDEVAQILDCTASNSRAQLAKAKQILRKKINDFTEKERKLKR